MYELNSNQLKLISGGSKNPEPVSKSKNIACLIFVPSLFAVTAITSTTFAVGLTLHANSIAFLVSAAFATATAISAIVSVAYLCSPLVNHKQISRV